VVGLLLVKKNKYDTVILIKLKLLRYQQVNSCAVLYVQRRVPCSR